MNRGFTLIELLMTILLLGALAVVSIGYFQEDINESRFLETERELEQIKNALIGDETQSNGSNRTNFGFQGDIGGLPAALTALTAVGTYPTWAVNTTNKIALGWRGPYLNDPTGLNDFSTDACGNSYALSLGTNPATITSYGANGIAGGTGFDTDLVISIPTSRFQGQVDGFISQIGDAYTGAAEIELYQPDGNGILETLTTTINGTTNGHFSFSGVSFGERSVKAFIPSKAAATTSIGPVPITVDKAFSQIPSTALVYAPVGAGCVESTKFAASAVPTQGRIRKNANETDGGGGKPYIFFTYKVTTPITITKILVDWSVANRTLSTISFDANAAGEVSKTCLDGTCNDNVEETLSSVYNAPGDGANKSFRMLFTGSGGGSMTGQSGTNMIIKFFYSGGAECTTITLSTWG